MGVLHDELDAENERLIAANEHADGPTGAFYRLARLVDTNKVAGWIGTETERGTNVDDLVKALGQMVMFMLLPAGGMIATHPHLAIQAVMADTALRLARVRLGQMKLDVLISTADESQSVHGTAEGLLNGGVPLNPKQEK